MASSLSHIAHLDLTSTTRSPLHRRASDAEEEAAASNGGGGGGEWRSSSSSSSSSRLGRRDTASSEDDVMVARDVHGARKLCLGKRWRQCADLCASLLLQQQQQQVEKQVEKQGKAESEQGSVRQRQQALVLFKAWSLLRLDELAACAQTLDAFFGRGVDAQQHARKYVQEEEEEEEEERLPFALVLLDAMLPARMRLANLQNGGGDVDEKTGSGAEMATDKLCELLKRCEARSEGGLGADASEETKTKWAARAAIVLQTLVNEAVHCNDLQLALSWAGYAAARRAREANASKAGTELRASDLNARVQLMHLQLMSGAVAAAEETFAAVEAAADAAAAAAKEAGAAATAAGGARSAHADIDGVNAAVVHRCRALLHLAHAQPGLAREQYDAAAAASAAAVLHGAVRERGADVTGAINSAICSIYDRTSIESKGTSNADLLAAVGRIEAVLDRERDKRGNDARVSHAVANLCCLYDLSRPQPAEDKRRVNALR